MSIFSRPASRIKAGPPEPRECDRDEGPPCDCDGPGWDRREAVPGRELDRRSAEAAAQALDPWTAAWIGLGGGR